MQLLSKAPVVQGERVTLASISRSGRIAAFRRPGAVELRETGSTRRWKIDAPGSCDFGFGAGGLWVLAGGYVHWMTEEGQSLKECLVGDDVVSLVPSRSALPSSVLRGRGSELCELYDGHLFSFPLVLGTREGEELFPIGPRLLGVATPDALRVVHLEHGNVFAVALEPNTRVSRLSAVFAGMAIAVVLSGPNPEIWLLSPTGSLIYRTSIERPDRIAIAEDRGIILVATGSRLTSIDLRHDVRDTTHAPFAVDDFDICARARQLIVASAAKTPRAWLVRYQDIFRDGD